MIPIKLLMQSLIFSVTSYFIIKAKNARAERGLRNNNPLNIKKVKGGALWKGEILRKSENKFVIFNAPEFGIRAAVKILTAYSERGIDNIYSIISTWSPDSENDTIKYVRFIKNKLQLHEKSVLTRANYYSLIEAMIYYENGLQPYPKETIKHGVDMAL